MRPFYLVASRQAPILDVGLLGVPRAGMPCWVVRRPLQAGAPRLKPLHIPGGTPKGKQELGEGRSLPILTLWERLPALIKIIDQLCYNSTNSFKIITKRIRNGSSANTWFYGALLIIGFLADIPFRIFRFPDILLLALGYLIGPVFNIIDTSQITAASQVIAVLALVVILFNGGLYLNFRSVISFFKNQRFFPH